MIAKRNDHENFKRNPALNLYIVLELQAIAHHRLKGQ